MGLLYMGVAYAMIGQENEALEALNKARTLWPESKDALTGVMVSNQRAIGLARLGLKDEAVAELVRLSSTPGGHHSSYHFLKNSVYYLPLRDHPGFQELLKDLETTASVY